MNDEFVLAIAYCFAYEKFGQTLSYEVLKRLGSGDAPRNDQEKYLQQILDVVRFAFQEIPEQESPEAFRSHLQQIQDKAEEIGDPEVALISGGATKIKQYVFESAKLPEIRGASALLDQINQVGIPGLFNRDFVESGLDPDDREYAQRVIKQFSQRHKEKESPQCPGSVVYANGGEVLAFAPTSLAQDLADEIEFLYTSQTLIANSVVVWKPYRLVELVGGLQPLRLFDRLEDESYRQTLLRELNLSSEDIVHKKCFGELVADLSLEKFRRRAGNVQTDIEGRVSRAVKPTAHWETFSYGRRCRSCERRVASHEFLLAGDQEPVCEPCYQKLQVGWQLKRTWVTRFEQFLEEEDPAEQKSYADAYYHVTEGKKQIDIRDHPHQRRWDRQSLPDRPQDLNEIGRAAKPQGYVGVIYADGNNMGALLEHLRTPHSYQNFAEEVHDATLGAVFQALKDLRPHKIERAERRRGKTEIHELWIHPFEILSIGGDDVFLIVPADKAIDIALSIAELIEKDLMKKNTFRKPDGYAPQHPHRCSLSGEERDLGNRPQSTVSLSAGVLLADAKTPIFYLQELVEHLLKSAKKRAKNLKKNHSYYGGTIDFMSLKSVTMLTGSLEEFRKESFSIGEHNLTARPYTLLEMRKLIETARALKAANFPRSQLYALRQALWQGRLASTVDYLYFTERLDETSRNRIREVLDDCWCESATAPWRRTDTQKWETVLVDLLELYEFVAE